MSNHYKIQLQPVVDLGHLHTDLELMAFSCGHDQGIHLLWAEKPLHLRDSQAGASFFKPRSEHPVNYRLLRYHADKTEIIEINNQHWHYTYAQSLQDDLLLVCPRSYYRGPNDIDANASLFNSDGQHLDSFVVGDGINGVQVTADGKIWVSYFDEGIFGNFGWTEPIGHSGLLRFTQKGDIAYQFEPTSELDSMADCYALNVVATEETWCYYYTEFPLVKIVGDSIVDWWSSPIAGSHCFAVSNGHVLFSGGYGARDTFHYCQLQPNHKMNILATFAFHDENDEPLPMTTVDARQSQIAFFHQNKIYRIDMRDL